jgi:hypothetical protein
LVILVIVAILVIVGIVALSLTQPTLNLASFNLGEIRELATRR